MKRSLVVSLALVLLAGALVGPAEAGKKKQKSVPVSWFLRNETDGCEDGALQLKLEQGADTTHCGYRVGGPLNEVLIAAGDVPLSDTYNAVEGLPVILDARKKITGSIFVASNVASAGPSTFVMELSGMVGNSSVELGSLEEEYEVSPAEDHEVKFQFPVSKKLNKKKLETLSITMYNRGIAPNHNHYRVSQSFITLPTLKK